MTCKSNNLKTVLNAAVKNNLVPDQILTFTGFTL